MSLMLDVGVDWQFCFDNLDSGILSGWFKNKPPQTKKVNLPHIWQKEPKWQESHIGFYFKQFQVDKAESAKRFFIRFDSIPHHATIWLNGEELGAHMGGYSSFDLDASKFIKIDGDNLLVIRIAAPDFQGRINGRSSHDLPLGSAYKRAPFSGILGNIHFLMGGRAGIRCINCFPDYEADRVTIETKFWNPKNYKAELEFTLTAPNGKSGLMPKFVKMERENDTYSLELSIDNAISWDPITPNLYKVSVFLRGSYAMEVCFGMRRVEIERCSFKINHQIRRIRGLNYTQVFPFYHGLSPMDFDRRQDLLNIRNAGFNLIRSAGAPLNKEVLDICDEIGLMVIQETTCYNQKSNKEGLEELKTQITSLIENTGYHPSIIAWGIGSENGSLVLENGNKLLRFASDLDPYRPIFSNLNSVFMNSSGVGKIDLGKVYDPTETIISSFESHKIKIGLPASTATQSMIVNYCTSKDARVINDGIHGGRSFWERYNYLKDELGGKILLDGMGYGLPVNLQALVEHKTAAGFQDHPEIQNLIEFQEQVRSAVVETGIWKSEQEFFKEGNQLCLNGLQMYWESILMNTQFSGYILEHWADFGNEFSGMVDWYRKPKLQLDLAKKLNQPVMVMASAEVRTPYMGTSAAINIYFINDSDLEDYGLLVRVKGPNGRIWHQESMPGKAKQGLNSIGRFKFPVGFEKGLFTFDLTLSQGKKELAKKEEIFFVPTKVELEPLLQAVCFKGNFPKAINYASKEDSKFIILHDFLSMKPDELKSLFEAAKSGATLVLGAVNFEEMETINNLEVLDYKLEGFRSTWDGLGTYHYAHKKSEFKDLPSKCIMDQIFADILPIWSIKPIDGAVEVAGCIALANKDLGLPKVRTGHDIAYLPLGKGKLVIYQLKIFNVLGKNALADVLFSNLLHSNKVSGI